MERPEPDMTDRPDAVEMPEVPPGLAQELARPYDLSSLVVADILTAAWPATGRTWIEWAADEFSSAAEWTTVEGGSREYDSMARALRTLAANLPEEPR